VSDPPSPGSAPTRIPALDGLRGLAILSVVLFHTTLPSQHAATDVFVYTFRSFGWAGVDLFFVLSGFLITGILCDSRGSPHYLRNFYARRALRILPLYYGFLAVFFLLGPRVAELPEGLTGQGVFFLFYVQNIATAAAGEWIHSDYLDLFWSLAIEEQFYLVWPFVVLALDRRGLLLACAALLAASTGLRIGLHLLADASAVSLYVATPTRLDPLAVGGFLAAAVRGPGGVAALVGPARHVAAGSGAVALAVAAQQGGLFYYLLPGSVTIGLTAVALLFGAVLVLGLAAPPTGRLGRLLGSRALRVLGRYSYALYVVHCVVQGAVAWALNRFVLGPLALAPTGANAVLVQLTMYVAVLGGSLGVAAASWRWLEGPCLRAQRHFRGG